MNIKELISILEKLPSDAEVFTETNNHTDNNGIRYITLLEESGDNLVFLANSSRAYTNDVNMDSKILQKFSWLDDFQNPVTS
jgi:hypothetical protein